MSYYKKASKFVFLIFTFSSFTSIVAADCLQPLVVNVKALISADTFVSIRDQVMDPSAGRIARQTAATINGKEINASINQQVEHIRCLAAASKNKQIVASISEGGTILLQYGVLTNSEKGVAVN